MSEIDKLAVAEMELGEKAKEFLSTDLGRFIDGCSQQDIDDAKDQLLEIDPYQYKTLEELQNAILKIQQVANVAHSLRMYVAEAVERGKQAMHKLSEEETDNG